MSFMASTIASPSSLSIECKVCSRANPNSHAAIVDHYSCPIQGKEKSLELDDGDGGGGGSWSGGFFFFGFRAFLGFLKDQESEGPYRDDRR